MKQQLICRRPLNGQDHFIIGTAYVKTKDLCRSLENCKEMYVNRLFVDPACDSEAGRIAAACCETGLKRVVSGKDSFPDFQWIPVPVTVSPEELRKSVYSAVLGGASGIVYDSLLKDRPARKNGPEPVFHFIQELNYRLTQYGRTMMALKPAAERTVIAEGGLPEDLAAGEFSDEENNRYLMIQNLDLSGRTAKPFSIKLSKEFRCYRVNPHNGKQVIVKDRTDGQTILIMPGDADLLRYQPADEEPYLIEYVLAK